MSSESRNDFIEFLSTFVTNLVYGVFLCVHVNNILKRKIMFVFNDLIQLSFFFFWNPFVTRDRSLSRPPRVCNLMTGHYT